MNEFHITPESRHYDQVLSIIRRTMEGSHGTVFIFGSRAQGNPRPASDIDIAVLTNSPAGALSSRLRRKSDDSTIPFTVDVMDFGSCDPVRAGEIQREGVVVWND